MCVCLSGRVCVCVCVHPPERQTGDICETTQSRTGDVSELATSPFWKNFNIIINDIRGLQIGYSVFLRGF